MKTLLVISLVILGACSVPEPSQDAAVALRLAPPEPRSSCGTICVVNSDCGHDILMRCRFCSLGTCGDTLITHPVEPGAGLGLRPE
jgi:hypothetical protein